MATKVVRLSFLTALSWFGPIIGPLLLAIRGENASALEKLLYVTLISPLAILGLSIRYAGDRMAILREPDSSARAVRLEERRIAYRNTITIVLIASCVSVGAAAWVLFGGPR
jgi:hypothetical protein